MKKITILIVEDHTLMRENLTLFLNSNEAFEVVGSTGSGDEAVDLVKTLSPDIVLMDINLIDTTGVEVTGLIKCVSPTTKIIGLSMHQHPAYAKAMIQKGAMGYITKNASQTEICTAITQVYEGQKYLSNEIKNKIADQMMHTEDAEQGIQSLSKREMEIIKLIKNGDTSKEIAEKLFISNRTAEVHRYNILKKLNLKNSAALVSYINQNEMAFGI